MPKVNLNRNDDDVAIKQLISFYLIERGLKKGDLSTKSGIPRSTVARDIKDPGCMTIDRYRRYCNVLKIPREERLC